MKKLRAFLAVELVEGIRERAIELARRISDARPDVKWVEAENLHITLKFLGDIDDVETWKVSQAIEPVVAELKRFQVTLSQLGAFPAPDRPRTLWVGVTEGSEQFVELAEVIDAKLSALGYVKEQRRFHPHVTLGRVRGSENKHALRAKLEEFSSAELGTMTVANVTLYSSQLRKIGPHYSRMATMWLGKD